MIINVTKNDIEKGIRSNSSRCPIARAIRRRVKEKIGVTMYSAYIGDNRIELPETTRLFIENYDDGKEVEPFKFILLYKIGEINGPK